MFAIDDVMAEVVASSTQPALGAIRLAWWREALERLDHTPPPAEPRLQAVAAHLVPRGVTGASLAALEDGWATLLDEEPDLQRAGNRGTHLFVCGAKILGVKFADETLGVAGRVFAGMDAGRRGFVDIAAGTPGYWAEKVIQEARPLTGLAVLAIRDLRRGGPPFEPEATPGRAFALIRHRLTGRIG